MLIKNVAQVALVLVLLAVAAVGSYFGGGLKQPAPAETIAQTDKVKTEKPTVSVKQTPKDENLKDRFTVTAERRKHILTGSEKGGGHKAGMGNPGKTEFPKEWSDDKIIDTANAIANDPEVPMRPSGKYWLKVKEVDGVKVRVVLNRENGEVVTSYPLNLPRNPGRSGRTLKSFE